MASPTQRSVLALIENSVPLVVEPYQWLADRLACTREQLLGVLAELRGGQGVIREISGIFDASAFGYEQTLVAMKVPPEQLDAAGAVAASHPGISHAYRRDHDWNLWMTLAVSPQSRLGLQGTLERISQKAQALDIQSLPSLRKYKLRVRFASEAQAGDPQLPKQADPLEITDAHVRAVRALQQDLPNRMRPFDSLARQAGLPCQELLERAAELLEARYMRRYAGVLRHRKAGASANVMSVWNPGKADPDAMGRILASSPRVSHCYLRPTRSDWPYGLYAMIHAATRQECLQSIEDLATQTGIDDYLLLWTQKEYAKKRLKLFSPDEARWEGNA